MQSLFVSVTVAAGLVVAGSAMATDMPELAKKNGCTACHTIDKKMVGPAWMDVAKKYKGAKTFSFKGKNDPLVDGLTMKVSQGGSGNWGTVAMTPSDPTGKKKDQIKDRLCSSVSGTRSRRVCARACISKQSSSPPRVRIRCAVRFRIS